MNWINSSSRASQKICVGDTGMSENTSVKIIVATHKEYRMPEDEMYLPLYVGAERKTGQDHWGFAYERDNTGENISELNPRFSELTGLYWAWKNIKADYIGLVQYRRHFSMKGSGRDPFARILTYKELRPYLGQIKVFTPKKRRYYIETLYSHYAHTHYANQLDETRVIIKETHPEYLSSYDAVVRHRSGHMFNMMIMEQPYFDDYCAWLFGILSELDERVDVSELSTFQGRYLGRISEILFNVWLDFQTRNGRLKQSQFKELPFIRVEKVNWLRKGAAFLKAKFLGVRYERSF